jgi:hypothetical protein
LNQRGEFSKLPTKLRKALNDKDLFIEAQQRVLEDLLAMASTEFENAFLQIVGTEVFDPQEIQRILIEIGFADELDRILPSFDVDGTVADFGIFQELLEHSAKVSEALDIPFALTAQNESDLNLFLRVKKTKFDRLFKTEIADDMFELALNVRLSNRPQGQIRTEITEQFAAKGRSASVEIKTALTAFDRAVMDGLYQEAGVERFIYWPNELVENSRDACRNALADPRQETGWTRQDIEEHPDLDFILGGKPFFNCQHTWLPDYANEL